MLGPNHQYHDLANQMHSERLSHAARIQMVARERHDERRPFNLEVARRITAARLAASAAGVALAFALAASVAANSPAVTGGGGAILIR